MLLRTANVNFTKLPVKDLCLYYMSEMEIFQYSVMVSGRFLKNDVKKGRRYKLVEQNISVISNLTRMTGILKRRFVNTGLFITDSVKVFPGVHMYVHRTNED